MELAALNETLRREFAPVLKLLRAPSAPSAAAVESVPKPPCENPAEPSTAAAAPEPSPTVVAAVGAPSPAEASVAAESSTSSLNDAAGASVAAAPTAPATATDLPQLARIDRFRQHCLALTRRLNAYQFASASAFGQEIAQLSLVARTPEQQQALQLLSERVAALETPEGSSERRVLGSLEFDTTAGIPGLQEVGASVLGGASSSSAAAGKRWLCNVNINEQSISIGSYLTRENALKAYDLFRFDLNTNRSGVSSVYKLADQIAVGQREADKSVLAAAADKIHSRLAWQRLHDMMPLAATAPPEKDATAPVTATTPSKTPQQRVAPAKTIPASPTSPVVSSAESTSAVAATGGAAKNQSRKRKKPAERLAHLRLRRLIQKRLCPHLKGKEVCVIRQVKSANVEDKVDWTPTGRLENGMVFVYKMNKQVTFAEYVADEMGHTVSACPHIFLVKSRESIDDHLLECDAFSDADRLQLGVDFTSSFQSYMTAAPEPKARKR